MSVLYGKCRRCYISFFTYILICPPEIAGAKDGITKPLYGSRVFRLEQDVQGTHEQSAKSYIMNALNIHFGGKCEGRIIIVKIMSLNLNVLIKLFF